MYDAWADLEPALAHRDRGPLLRFLMENPGRVHSREALLAEVWGEDYGGGSRTVDVHVRRLRHKLGRAERQSRTVRTVGYGFEG